MGEGSAFPDATAPSRSWLGLVGWLLVTFIAAAAGSFASLEGPAFYAQLTKPSWAPPAWLFGPVWTTLYLLMAVAAWLVWREHGWRGARGVLSLYVVQLAANAMWTWLFFVWRQGAIAFVEILALWLLVAATIVSFARMHRMAAALLAPYLTWVTFATALCYSCWKLNPGLLR
jgi:tryptophan-rich sensory protein